MTRPVSILKYARAGVCCARAAQGSAIRTLEKVRRESMGASPSPKRHRYYLRNGFAAAYGTLTSAVDAIHADVAELADALVSGISSRKRVEVQVLSSAPKNKIPDRRQDCLSCALVFVDVFEIRVALQALF